LTQFPIMFSIVSDQQLTIGKRLGGCDGFLWETDS
jgi:hypothetical protein